MSAPRTLGELTAALAQYERDEQPSGPFVRNMDGTPVDGWSEQYGRMCYFVGLAEFRREIESADGFQDLRTFTLRTWGEELTAVACRRVIGELLQRNPELSAPQVESLTLTDAAGRLSATPTPLTPTPPAAVVPGPADTRTPGMPLSLLDMPAVRSAVSDLYRILENPIPKNPTASRVFRWATGRTTLGEQSPDAVLPAGFIQAGVEWVMSHFGDHHRDHCPEITDSNLDLNTKAALLELRDQLTSPFASHELAHDAGVRLPFLVFLAGVIDRIALPTSGTRQTEGGTTKPDTDRHLKTPKIGSENSGEGGHGQLDPEPTVGLDGAIETTPLPGTPARGHPMSDLAPALSHLNSAHNAVRDALRLARVVRMSWSLRGNPNIAPGLPAMHSRARESYRAATELLGGVLSWYREVSDYPGSRFSVRDFVFTAHEAALDAANELLFQYSPICGDPGTGRPDKEYAEIERQVEREHFNTVRRFVGWVGPGGPAQPAPAGAQRGEGGTPIPVVSSGKAGRPDAAGATLSDTPPSGGWQNRPPLPLEERRREAAGKLREIARLLPLSAKSFRSALENQVPWEEPRGTYRPAAGLDFITRKWREAEQHFEWADESPPRLPTELPTIQHFENAVIALGASLRGAADRLSASSGAAVPTEPPTVSGGTGGTGGGVPAEQPPTPEGDLTQLRLRCYPPVPLAELLPRRPEPPQNDTSAAMRDVPTALTESRFGGPTLHLPADPSEHHLDHPAWLAFAQECGHGRAAAEWAIYRLAEAGRLCVVWPSADQNKRVEDAAQTNEAQAARYRGGRPATVTDWDLFEDGRILQIRSTPALWEWSRSETTVGAQQGKGGMPPADLPSGVKQSEEGPPNWAKLGDAKRAIIKVLCESSGRLQGQGIAKRAGYKYGSLRHHFGALRAWGYIDKEKDGYALTPAGAVLVSCEPG